MIIILFSLVCLLPDPPQQNGGGRSIPGLATMREPIYYYVEGLKRAIDHG
jgi:hypothetical protein